MSELTERIALTAADEMWVHSGPVEAVHDVVKRMGIDSYQPAVEGALQRFRLFYRRDWGVYMDAKSAATIDLSEVSGPPDFAGEVAQVKRQAIDYIHTRTGHAR